MSEIDELMAVAATTRPTFVVQPNADGLVAAVLRLAMEISVLRDRLDVHETLAEQHGVGGEGAIEAFVPDPQLSQRRQRRRQRLVELLVRDLTAAG